MSEMEMDIIEDDAVADGAPEATVGSGGNIDAMLNVMMDVKIVLGESKMPISQILRLGRGSVIEIDKKIGESVDIIINDRVVARGDLVKVNDVQIGITLNEIVKEHVSEF